MVEDSNTYRVPLDDRCQESLTRAYTGLAAALDATLEAASGQVGQAALEIVRCLEAGGKVLVCGNGGSAADSQHIAAEFVNRFRLDRVPLAAIALTTDTSILTACGNDFGFQFVFRKQVEALGRQGDVLWAISTSGDSENVIEAIHAARKIGMTVIGFTGASGGAMAELCDITVKAVSDDTPRIQEVQIFLAHVICEVVEAHMCGPRGDDGRR